MRIISHTFSRLSAVSTVDEYVEFLFLRFLQ